MKNKFSIRESMPKMIAAMDSVINKVEQNRLKKLAENTLEETTDEAVKKVEDLFKDK